MARVHRGTARIVIVIALVAGGIALLANGFGGATIAAGLAGDGSNPGPGSSVSPHARHPRSPKQLPSPQVHGVTIAVFNGTNTIGLAGQVEQTLEADGYVKAQNPANAPSRPVPKTVVYFRGGATAAQNRSDAKYVANHYLNHAAVKLLGPDQANAVSRSAQIVIILGIDYASANGG
jgi:hypothetical protein